MHALFRIITIPLH